MCIIFVFIGKVHSQLRRLRNESSILKDAVITAIPAHYSRVLFTCTRITSPLKCIDYYLHQPTDDKEKNTVSLSKGLLIMINAFFHIEYVFRCRNKLVRRKPRKNSQPAAARTGSAS